MTDSEMKEHFKRQFLRDKATPKQVRDCIKELRSAKKLPASKKEYRPNIAGIRHVFAENAAQVTLVYLRYWKANKLNLNQRYYDQGKEYKELSSKTHLNIEEIIDNMLSEIILCDYYKRDYQLPEPKKPEYLGGLRRRSSCVRVHLTMC